MILLKPSLESRQW